jgi:glycerol-3-phosphate dehydrogenase
VPTETTKGVLVAPTVFGNVMLGPTAVDIERRTIRARRRTAWPTRSLGHRLIRTSPAEVTAVHVSPACHHHLTTSWSTPASGTRGPEESGRRPTGSMAIAEHVRDELDRCGAALRERLRAFRSPHGEHRRGEAASLRPADRIAETPTTGGRLVVSGRGREDGREPGPAHRLPTAAPPTGVPTGRRQGFPRRARRRYASTSRDPTRCWSCRNDERDEVARGGGRRGRGRGRRGCCGGL